MFNFVTRSAGIVVAMYGLLVIAVGAAFLPVSRVFDEPSPAHKLEIITASPNAWTAAQILFGIGAMLTIGGLALAAFHLRGERTA